MWVICGRNLSNGTESNKVRYSTDGINWVLSTNNALSSARDSHSSVVFDPSSGLRMWAIGGRMKNAKPLAQVWYSPATTIPTNTPTNSPTNTQTSTPTSTPTVNCCQLAANWTVPSLVISSGVAVDMSQHRVY